MRIARCGRAACRGHEPSPGRGSGAVIFTKQPLAKNTALCYGPPMEIAARPAPPKAAKRPRGRPRKTVEDRDDGNRRQQLLRSAATPVPAQGLRRHQHARHRGGGRHAERLAVLSLQEQGGAAVRRDGGGHALGHRAAAAGAARAAHGDARRRRPAAHPDPQPLRRAARPGQRLHPGHAVRGALDHAAPARGAGASCKASTRRPGCRCWTRCTRAASSRPT